MCSDACGFPPVRTTRPQRTVYWVNLWFGRHGYSRLPEPTKANRILRHKAEQYPNLHLNDIEYRFRNQAIVAALQE